MKINAKKISINEFLNRNKPFSLVINSLLSLFFSFIRIIRKTYSNIDGSIAIISLHRLGDTIFTISAIKEIQKFYGDKIHIICFPESVQIYNLAISDVDFCIIGREDFSLQGRMASRKARSKLKSLNPGIIIDITGSMISASLIFNSRARKIIGINGNQFKSIYDKFVEFRKRPQLKDIYLDAISPVIPLLNRDELTKRQSISKSNGRIIIHPFAGWREKEWNLKKYICLTEKIKKNYSVCLVVSGGELSIDVVEEIKYLDLDLIQTNSVEELIQNIKDCSMFIGNDSGPVNIANFLGKPTFTIYGSTNPEYTASSDEHQTYIQKILNCSAGQNEKCCIIGGAVYSCSGTQCMNFLTVEEVYDNLIPKLKKYCQIEETISRR